MRPSALPDGSRGPALGKSWLHAKHKTETLGKLPERNRLWLSSLTLALASALSQFPTGWRTFEMAKWTQILSFTFHQGIKIPNSASCLCFIEPSSILNPWQAKGFPSKREQLTPKKYKAYKERYSCSKEKDHHENSKQISSYKIINVLQGTRKCFRTSMYVYNRSQKTCVSIQLYQIWR